jgi:hypothetical protein
VLIEQITSSGNGYSLVNSPSDEQYRMSIFVRYLKKASPSAASKYLKSGFEGISASAALSYATGGGYRNATAGGIIGGLVSTTDNALLKGVTYLLVADIQIKEKQLKGSLCVNTHKLTLKLQMTVLQHRLCQRSVTKHYSLCPIFNIKVNDQLRQKVGENSTNNENTSNLPKSIAIINNHFPLSDTSA